MILRADFGWLIFVAFLFWIFRMLQAGTRGGGRGRVPPPPMPPGPPQGTQREGAELEELLRQLEGRLGGRLAGRVEPRPKVVVKRPAQTGSAPARRVATDETTSLEAAVDRTAEAEALERTRLAAAAARDRELTEVDHAAFEARIKDASAPLRSSQAGALRLTAQQLRDAVLWQEILGPPKGLR
jgi:hypothetical protein